MKLRHYFHNKTISRKLFLATLASSTISLLLVVSAIFTYEFISTEKRLIEKLQAQSAIIAENSTAVLSFDDAFTAKNILRALKRSPHIIFSGIYSAPDSQLFAFYHRDGENPTDIAKWKKLTAESGKYKTANSLGYTEPVYLDKEIIGHVLIISDTKEFTDAITAQAAIIFIVFISALSISLFLFARLSNNITKPIKYMASVADSIGQTKNYSIRFDKHFDDELEQLIKAFNSMLTQIEQRSEERDRAEKELSIHTDNLQELITERTADLIESKNLAESASRTKSAFLANISHEIRTPMNAIIGFSHMALQTDSLKKKTEFLDHISTSAELLMEIINDVLDFSKIEADKIILDRSAFSLRDLFSHIFNIMESKADDKGLDFILNISSDIPDILIGDSLRIEQIVINLASNAIKFTEKGSIHFSVNKIYGNKQDITLEFSVKDTGIGIEEDKLKELFEPFTQADLSTTRIYGGTGLGLAISNELAKLMGSEISVSSRPSSGSTFSFTANLEVSHNSAPDIHDSEKTDSKKDIYLHNAEILLVDDVALNKKLISEILKPYGINIALASNGDEALEKLNQHKFDLVLLDIQMPRLDGYQTIDIIRKNPRYSELPVIAMTAHAMPEDYKKCIDAGMSDYISKPIHPEKLLELLAHWLDKKMPGQPQADSDRQKPSIHLPSDLPGIDVNLGLKYASQDEKLYTDLLLYFLSEHKNIKHDLSEAIAKGKSESHEYIHMLKGMTANLAMTNLHNMSTEIEKQLNSGLADESSLLQFSVYADEVIRGLQKLESRIKTANNSLSEFRVSKKQLHLLIDDLESNLVKHSFRSQTALLELLSAFNENKPEICNELKSEVNAFHFREAEFLCKQLHQHIDQQGNA